jgi:NAD+ kinase
MNEFDAALDSLLKGEVEIDDRVVLELESDLEELQQFPYALNDVVVQKRDTSAMISVRTKLNGDRLNNYLADGLILATPTGSTGYNMSCGGPLLIPGSNSFVLTPIAAHNLTVRPVVIPDLGKLEFEVGDTSDTVLISLDSRSYQVDSGITFSVKRAHFKFRMYRLKGTTHMDTIRNKLLWGIDSRNR